MLTTARPGNSGRWQPLKRKRLECILPATKCLLLLILGLSSTGAFADKPATDKQMADVASTAPRDPMEYFFHQSFNNLPEELAIAADEGKAGVFIMFSDVDCPWCAKMKATIMSQVAVQDYYRKHFQVLTIDIRGDAMIVDFEGKEMSEKDFAFKEHRVRATPVVMFFDNSGKAVARFTGIVRDVDEFLWLGEYVVSGAFQEMNFTKYKRNRKQQEQHVSSRSSS